jgi:hypothetical protein
LNPAPPQENDISIGPFWLDSASNTSLIGLRNITSREIDLSGCIIKIGRGHKLLIMPELPELSPGDTLFVTNHYELSPTLAPQSIVTGNLCFIPAVGDTVYLETSGGQMLSYDEVDVISQINEAQGTVIINEINYNSDNDFDPGDWVELYAISGTTNLHNWKLRDCRNDHTYSIPTDIILNEGEYFILAQDTISFSECFPVTTNKAGNWGFGLSADGDIVRLYNSQNILVDCVSYDNISPWPEEPDGNGATLELVNPTLENYNHENWGASIGPFTYGSPGMINSIYSTVNKKPGILKSFDIISIYPNPFNSSIRIRYSANRPGSISIEIYDVLGRKVNEIRNNITSPGDGSIIWDGRTNESVGVSSGIYFIKAELGGMEIVKKVVVIR